MTPEPITIARLGSRFSLRFDPTRRQLTCLAAGLPHPVAAKLLVELRADGLTAAFPFAGDRPGFAQLSQEQSLTRVTYQGDSPAAGTRVTLEWVAPFLPHDLKLSLAPVYLLHLRLERKKPRHTARAGVLRVELDAPELSRGEDSSGLRYRYPPLPARPEDDQVDAGVAPFRAALRPLRGAWRQVDGGLELDCDSGDGSAIDGWLALGAWSDAPCSAGPNGERLLKYVSAFGSLEAVLDHAAAEQDRILAAAEFVASLLTDSSLPSWLQDRIAVGFHGFLSRTRWTESDGQDGFSADPLTGGTAGPMDQDTPFYFGFWPELFELSFASGAAPVGPAADWLPRLQAHAVWWGRATLGQRCREFIRAGAEGLLSDAPDSPRIAALWAAARRLEQLGDPTLARRCDEAVERAMATLADDEPLVGDAPSFAAWLYLHMIDDLPPALDLDRLRRELHAARGALDRATSSLDFPRDLLSAWLGDERFTPDHAPEPGSLAGLGALWAAAGLRVRATDRLLSFAPPSRCRIPLLPLVDWADLRAPWLEAEPVTDGLDWSLENEDLLAGWELVPIL